LFGGVCSLSVQSGFDGTEEARVTEADELIVDFSAPPVVEVIAGVAFELPGSETGALLAAFWKERLREYFPRIEQQPPYIPPVEMFGGPSQTNLRGVEISSEFPAARLLASTPDRQELIQLQPGWFACNWRKVGSDDEYQHWPKRQESFNRWFTELSEYLVAAGAATPKVTQCEVTYVNHIISGGTWKGLDEFHRIFTASLGGTDRGDLEQITAQAQFLLSGDQGPYGRLHMKILPAYARDGQTPLYVLELTARGMFDGTASNTDFLRVGREAVVRSFLQMTTPDMHAEWGMKER
jgi:uncharacterized protein (TIGR04255 family)